MTQTLDYLHALRLAELDRALALLDRTPAPKPAKVLEVGASDGFVAAELARRFAAVEAVDVAVPARTWFKVRRYDGQRLPFADASFDLVYSSNVMEHVAHFDDLQRELARVLGPGGVAIHVMPSATWRLWTSLAHYPALPRAAWARLKGRPQTGALAPDAKAGPDAFAPDAGAGSATRPARTLGWWLRRIALATRHGEEGSMLGEVWNFSRWRWRQRFASAGWHVVAIHPVGYFYTGYMLAAGRLGFARRAQFARVLGSSTLAYKVTPPAPRQ